MSAARLTPIGPAHGAVLAALHQASFDTPWDADAFVRLLAVPGTFGYLALTHDDPVGFVLCRAIAGENEILSLAVRPALRRAGIGRALLEAALDEAAGRAATSTILEVAADNDAAKALYRGLGFRKVGSRPGYYQMADGHAEDAELWRRGDA